MAARRSVKAINWAAIAERLYPEERAIFSAVKAKSDNYLRMMESYPEKSPKINWEFYKKHITVPGMVDNFKKQYEALTIPYPKDTYTELVEAQAKAAEAEVKKYLAECDVEAEKANKEIQRVKGLLPFEAMTMDDMKDMYPEIAFDPLNNPTVWPHRPEDQIDNPQEEHV